MQASCWMRRGSFCIHTALLLRLGSCRVPFSPTLLWYPNLACLQLLEPDRMLSRLSSCLSAAVLTLMWLVPVSWSCWRCEFLSSSCCVFTLKVTAAPTDQRLLPMGFASFIYESEAKNGEWWSSLGLRVWVGRSGTAEVPARVDDESQLLRSHCCKHGTHISSVRSQTIAQTLLENSWPQLQPTESDSSESPSSWQNIWHDSSVRPRPSTAQLWPGCMWLISKHCVVSETWNTSVCTQRGWTAALVWDNEGLFCSARWCHALIFATCSNVWNELNTIFPVRSFSCFPDKLVIFTASSLSWTCDRTVFHKLGMRTADITKLRHFYGPVLDDSCKASSDRTEASLPCRRTENQLTFKQQKKLLPFFSRQTDVKTSPLTSQWSLTPRNSDSPHYNHRYMEHKWYEHEIFFKVQKNLLLGAKLKKHPKIS